METKKQYAISKIITQLSCKYGAPMGRPNIGHKPNNPMIKIFKRKVPMSIDSAYDKGGAYWGLGKTLFVEYTKDLSYINFYRS